MNYLLDEEDVKGDGGISADEMISIAKVVPDPLLTSSRHSLFDRR